MRFIDLTKEYKRFQKSMDRGVSSVFARGQFILGKEVSSFENEFSRYCGIPYAIGVKSGTDAIYLALRAFGIGPGDEVLTVSHTAVPTVAAICMTGAAPVYVDVTDKDMTMDPDDAARKITKKTRCVIPVHIYGYPCRMDSIMRLAKKKRLKVIEDACQSHGSTFNGKKTGTIGDAGCFSFYPTKNLGAYGDAGMVVTRNKEIARKISALRRYGETEKHLFFAPGINSRLSDIQAALLRVKLRVLDSQNRKRRQLARIYNNELKDIPLRLPVEEDLRYHVYHLYVIRTRRRSALIKWLASRNVATMIHYPYTLHKSKVYAGKRRFQLPVTDKIKKEIVSLPLYAEMSRNEVIRSARRIREFFRKR